jgi:hypothetical protein
VEKYKEDLLKLVVRPWGQVVKESLDWSTNLKFYLWCNDLFWWAVADTEAIESEEDLELLESCFADLKVPLDGSTDNYENEYHVVWLYCCRKRKMRPQTAAFKHIPKKFWKLFKDCGPVRKKDFGNPYTFKNVEEEIKKRENNTGE